MHIERIHKMIECLTDKALEELENGVEHVDTHEYGQVVDMIKDLTDAEYKAVIVKAMKEADEEEKEYDKELLRMFKAEYGEDDGRRHYDAYRYADGRFAPKGHGTRRGYAEPPYFHQMPSDYRTWSDMPERERMRDLDRMDGRMHYTEPVRDSREGRSGTLRKAYIETKELHKDKDTTMQALERLLHALSEEIVELSKGMGQDERTMLRSNMANITNKIAQ